MAKKSAALEVPFAPPSWPALYATNWDLGKIKPHPDNPRSHPESQIDMLASLMKRWGVDQPIVVDEEGVIIKGHGRLLAAHKAGFKDFPVVQHSGLDEVAKTALRIADNNSALLSGWHQQLLSVQLAHLQDVGFDMPLLGFGDDMLLSLIDPEAFVKLSGITLAQRFGVVPFTVFNAREGWWQERKRAWLALGMRPELGRGENLLKFSDSVKLDGKTYKGRQAAPHRKGRPHPTGRAFGQDLMKGENKKFLAVPGRGTGGGAYLKKTPQGYKTDREIQNYNLKGGLALRTTIGAYRAPDEETTVAQGTGTSIFDPVLCELCYRWFCPPGGVVWNPFMGESSPGIVASRLKLKYFSIDVRAEQAQANKLQSDTICKDYPEPQWLVGDSAQAEPSKICGGPIDFVFSCPPYANLEVYSDDPQDLSTMEYPDFLIAYRKIIKKAYDALKPNRFACFVVGEVRDDKGNYIGFVPDTVRAFTDAGFHYYNEGILVTAVGSLPVRVRRQFEVARKLGKTHQNVLVFCKGDARKASAAVGKAEFGDIQTDVIMPEAVAAPTNRWKVSAAWLSKNHDCTLAGIHARCHGGCCHSASFWPPKSNPDGSHDCLRLGPNGCTYSAADKPVTCLLYPLMLNKNDTIILHHRTTGKTSVCKGNFGQGPPIIDALKDNLIELFGADQYARIREDVMSGKDSYVDVSDAVLTQIKHERELEEQNVPPIPRSQVQ